MKCNCFLHLILTPSHPRLGWPGCWLAFSKPFSQVSSLSCHCNFFAVSCWEEGKLLGLIVVSSSYSSAGFQLLQLCSSSVPSIINQMLHLFSDPKYHHSSILFSPIPVFLPFSYFPFLPPWWTLTRISSQNICFQIQTKSFSFSSWSKNAVLLIWLYQNPMKK